MDEGQCPSYSPSLGKSLRDSGGPGRFSVYMILTQAAGEPRGSATVLQVAMAGHTMPKLYPRLPWATALLLGTALALDAGSAVGDDSASRALLQRQQQSDEFSLQLQQSIQSHRSGSLTPQQRLELDAFQRDQRLRQSDTFYRQRIEQPPSNRPESPALRRAEALRMEQERQRELARFREEAAWQVERSKTPPLPAPLGEPTIVP
jgi:hypothetical protein